MSDPINPAAYRQAFGRVSGGSSDAGGDGGGSDGEATDQVRDASLADRRAAYQRQFGRVAGGGDDVDETADPERGDETTREAKPDADSDPMREQTQEVTPDDNGGGGGGQTAAEEAAAELAQAAKRGQGPTIGGDSGGGQATTRDTARTLAEAEAAAEAKAAEADAAAEEAGQQFAQGVQRVTGGDASGGREGGSDPATIGTPGGATPQTPGRDTDPAPPTGTADGGGGAGPSEPPIDATNPTTEFFEREFQEFTGLDAEQGESFYIYREDDQLVARPTERFQQRYGEKLRRTDLDPSTGISPLGTAQAGQVLSILQSRAEQLEDPGTSVSRQRFAQIEQTKQELQDVLGEIDNTLSGPAAGAASVDGANEAKSAIEQDLESQIESEYGTRVNLTGEDIAYSTKQTDSGSQITGELTPAGERQVRVETRPQVQATEGTLLGGIFRAGAEADVRYQQFTAKNKAALFGTIEDITGVRPGEYEPPAAGLESKYQATRQQVVVDAGELAQPLVNAAAFTGPGVAAAALNRAGVDPTDTGIPSPVERPGSFAAAALPFAAAEPTPAGEVAVGAAAALGTAALVSQRTTGTEAEGPVDVTARATTGGTAEVPGMFPPEQEVPEDRSLFVPEQETGPSSLELPELLPPTDPNAVGGSGRLTPPEIEQPQEPLGRGFFPSEQPQPEEPIGRGFYPSEVPSPVLGASPTGALVGGGETAGRSRRPRRRRRRTVPDELIPDEPATIGGPIGRAGEAREPSVGGGGAPQFIFRPNPRSMDLWKVETDEGGFELGPEWTRFRRSQTLDADLAPEIDPFGGAETPPPASEVGGEFAALGEFGLAERQEAAGVDEFAMATPALDILSDVDVDIRQRPETATSPISLEDVVQEQETRSNTRYGEGYGTPEITEPTSPSYGNPFADVSADAFAPGYGLATPIPSRTPKPELESADRDRRRDDEELPPWVERVEYQGIDPLTGR